MKYRKEGEEKKENKKGNAEWKFQMLANTVSSHLTFIITSYKQEYILYMKYIMYYINYISFQVSYDPSKLDW